MNARELAKLLKLHPETIRRMIREDEIKAVKKGRSYVIPQSEVNRLLANKISGDHNQELQKSSYTLINEYKSKIEVELSLLLVACSSLLTQVDSFKELEVMDKYKKLSELYSKGHFKKLFDSVETIKRSEQIIQDLEETARNAEKMNSPEKVQNAHDELERFDTLLKNLGDEDSRKEFQKLVSKWNDEK